MVRAEELKPRSRSDRDGQHRDARARVAEAHARTRQDVRRPGHQGGQVQLDGQRERADAGQHQRGADPHGGHVGDPAPQPGLRLAGDRPRDADEGQRDAGAARRESPLLLEDVDDVGLGAEERRTQQAAGGDHRGQSAASDQGAGAAAAAAARRPPGRAPARAPQRRAGVGAQQLEGEDGDRRDRRPRRGCRAVRCRRRASPRPVRVPVAVAGRCGRPQRRGDEQPRPPRPAAPPRRRPTASRRRGRRGRPAPGRRARAAPTRPRSWRTRPAAARAGRPGRRARRGPTVSAPPPRPWSTRPASSTSMVGAAAHTSRPGREEQHRHDQRQGRPAPVAPQPGGDRAQHTARQRPGEGEGVERLAVQRPRHRRHHGGDRHRLERHEGDEGEHAGRGGGVRRREQPLPRRGSPRPSVRPCRHDRQTGEASCAVGHHAAARVAGATE